MIVIVEGKHDYEKLKSIFPSLYILMSNGTEVSDSFLNQVKTLSKTNEIVLCLDPDYPGEKIRRKIMEVVPNAMHVYANKKDAISKNKRKVGIEHMSKKDIITLFENIQITDRKNIISNISLFELGLIGSKNSKVLRQKLCEKLNLGYVNGKQLATRLSMHNISMEKIKENL